MSDLGAKKTGAWLFTAACLAVTGVLAFVAVRAEKVTDQMAFLPETAEVGRFLEINRRYNNFNTVLIGLESSDILAPDNLTKLRDLTNAVGKVAGVSWLSSITNVPDMSASEEGVVVNPLISEIPKDKAAAAALKARILKTRQVVGELVSADFTSALVPVTMYGDKTAEVYPKIEQIARKAGGGDMKIYFHGAPAIDQFLARGGDSLMFLGLFAGGVFLMALLFGLRPRRLPAWLLVVAPAAAAGMAAPVLFKFPASGLSMASGLAAFVFGTMVVFSYPGQPRSDDGQRRFRWWRGALLFGAILLAIVFVSLTMSSTLPLRGLGAGLATAVLVIGLFAPLALRFGTILTGGGVPAGDAGQPPRPAIRFGWPVVLAPVVLALAVVALSPRPSATNDLADTFGANAEPLQAVRFLDRRFGGSEYLTVAADGDYAHPGFLRGLDELAEAVRATSGVAGVVSPTDVFKMINEAMIGQYRIPDTIGQMESLWFFFEGQPELGALLYKREQGLMQIRLSPDGAKRSPAVIAEIRRLMDKVPARIGHVDLRLLSDGDAARLRERQLQAAEKALASSLGQAAQGRIRETLGSITPLGLKPVSKSPDARVQAAFRERLTAAINEAFSAYFASPAAPVTLTPGRIAELTQAIAVGSNPGAPDDPNRQGADSLLKGWFPVDEAAMAKLSTALHDKARDAQDKALARLLIDERQAAGGSGAHGVSITPVMAAALSDFTSPHVFVDAGREPLKFESVTQSKFDLSGYPVIAPAIARETYEDLSRGGLHAAIAAGLLMFLALAARRRGAGLLVALGLLAVASALSWQVGWLRGYAWAVDMSAFIPISIAFAAAAGAWLVVAGGARGAKDLAWAAVMTAAPLLVMAFAGFAPVRNLMGMSVLGIAGAALAGWLALPNIPASISKK